MKLYTEEQVIKCIELSRLTLNNGSVLSKSIILAKLSPIELPSNKEIEEEARDENIYNNLQFRKGARWMRDKIFGGNK